MHIAALTLNPASTLSHGFRHTVLVVPLSSAPLAAFLLRLAMGGVPVVTRLIQCRHLRRHTDVLLISEGDLILLTTSKVQARILLSGGATCLSPLLQFTTFLLPPGEPLFLLSRLWRRLLLTLFLFPSTASLSRRSRRRMIISLRGI